MDNKIKYKLRKTIGYLKIKDKSHSIYEGHNIIGRDLKATVKLKASVCSKQHAILTVVDANTFFISDLHSSNGTKVRNIELVPYQLYRINNNESIIFGDVVAVFHTSGSPKAKTSNYCESQSIDYQAETQKLSIDLVKSQKSQKEINIWDLETERATRNLSQTEVYDDSFTNQSLRNSILKNQGSVVNQEVDETVIPSKKVSFIEDDDDIILSTQDNLLIEKKSYECLHGNNYIIDDDSETDVEEEILKACTEKLNKLSQNNEKNLTVIEDTDSGTDVDDDLLANCNLNTNSEKINLNNESSNENLGIYMIDSDDDMDLLGPIQICESILPNSQVDDKNDNLPSTQLLKSNVSHNLPPTQLLDETFIDNIPPTLLLEEIFSTNVDTIELHKNKNQLEKTDFSSESLCLKLSENSSKKNSETFPGTSESKSENEGDKLDETLEETQLLKIKSSKVERSQNNKVKETEDKSKSQNQKEENEITKKLKSDDSENVTDDFNIHDAETELVESKFNEIKVNNENNMFSTATQLLDEKKLPQKFIFKKQNVNKDVFLAPTQLLTVTNDKEDKSNEDDIFLQPTQRLNENDFSDKTKKDRKNDENDIFLQPTQKLNQNFDDKTEKEKKSGENDIFLQPTQKLNENDKAKKVEKSDENDIFLQPTQRLSENDLNDKAKKGDKTDENDIFLQPTQKLNLNTHKKPLVLLHNLKLKTTKSKEDVESASCQLESQLEVDFALETQKLYIEEQTSRPNNPLAHMFDEQNTEVDDEDIKLNENPYFTIKNKTKTDKSRNNDSNSPTTVNSKGQKVSKPDESSTRTSDVMNTEKKKTPVVVLNNVVSVNSNTDNRNTTRRKISETKNTSSPATSNTNTKTRQASELILVDEISNTISSSNNNKTNEKVSKLESSNDSSSTIYTRRRKAFEAMSIGTLSSNSTSSSSTNNKKGKVSKLESSDDSSSTISTRRRKAFEAISIDTLSSSNSTSSSTVYNKKGKVSKLESSDDSSSTINTRRRKASEIISTDDTLSSSNSTLSTIANNKKGKVSKLESSDDSSSSINTRRRKAFEAISIDTLSSSNSTSSSIANNKKGRVSKLGSSDDSSSTMNTRKRKTSEAISTDNSSLSSNPFTIPRNKKEEKVNLDDSSSSLNISFTRKSKRIAVNSPDKNTSDSLYSPVVKRHKCQLNQNQAASYKVIFTLLDEPNLETVVHDLGGVVISSVDSDSVLVAKKISRSFKFLMAITLSIPIVNTQWINDSAKKNSFQDPWKYFLEDKDSEKKYGFSLKESVERSGKKKLYDGYEFFVITKQNTQVIKDIIEANGGTNVKRFSSKRSKIYVVSYKNEKKNYAKYLNMPTTVVVDVEAIFLGTLTQQICWDKYLLC